MARFMPRSNLPQNENLAGDMYMDFPDVSELRKGEWEVVFEDFRETNGPSIAGANAALADYFTDNAWWVVTDHGTMTDVATILVADGHSLAELKTDVTDTEGYEIQNIAEQVKATANRTILFEALVGVEDADATDVFIGINEVDTSIITTATGAVALNNGAGFRLLDSEGTGTWACIHGGSTGGTVDAGDAGTSSDSTIASGVLTNFVRLGVKIEGITTPTITWYFNGLQVQTATATIFDAVSLFTMSVLGSGAVEILWVDYFMLAQTRTVA